MRRILLVPLLTMFGALTSFGTDCTSAIQVREHVRNGKRTLTAKNVSSRPILAHVIAGSDRDATGNPIHVFYGVFDDGDSLRPSASMEIGSVSSESELTLFVDYVRASGGWSCGTASTQQAKEVVSQFHE